MIKFLLTGLLRDRQRSIVPIIIVALGVMLTIVFQSWILGIISDSIEYNARFTTGHVKVMTGAYADNINQMPNDLALTGTDTLLESLNRQFPDMEWVERIHFAGLVDVPDSRGETSSQGPAVGFGIDLLSGNSSEVNRMNISQALRKGRLPEKEGEIMLSDLFCEKLKLEPGDPLTLISTTMYGEMAIYNFVLAGTAEFGTTALDRGTIFADIHDVRKALNMENSTGEIMGYFRTGYYDDDLANPAVREFNRQFHVPSDEYSPVMMSLKEQGSMRVFVDFASMLMAVVIFVFIFAMSIVLWNAGLLGGLRRYGEFGMRLAIGEEKDHVYKTILIESLGIGIIGSVAGTIIGMGFAWYLQEYGIDIGMMKNATIMMPTVFRGRITIETWYIGFIPGVVSTLIGTALSGIGIYKRQTAQLFKELGS
jgi:putative ABC transport system permease protein